MVEPVTLNSHLPYKNNEEMAAYLEAIFRTALDAIFTIDEQGIVESMNPAAEKLFGYHAEEVVGKNISLLMPLPDRERHDNYLRRYLKGGRAQIIGIGREVEGLHRSGKRLPLRLAVNETRLNGRRFFTGILHDLSDVKQAEAQILLLNENLARQNDELERKVMKRTEELSEAINSLLSLNQQLEREVEERKSVEAALRKSEKELKKSLAKARELNELKSRFVSMASHEFRTPLSTVLSSADLIEAYPNAEQQDKRLKHVQRIKSAVDTLTNILNDFLSLSKLEENKVQVQPSEFILYDFCEEVMDEMQGLLKAGQEIRRHHEGSEKTVFLDKKILKNILFNLLSNATKYSEPGQPIDCKILVKEHRLYIEITDYGIGIPDEDQPFLFDRFFRANNVENIQGTGLGLNIVKRYLDLLGGEIHFKSKVGTGTTFEVIIPSTDH